MFQILFPLNSKQSVIGGRGGGGTQVVHIFRSFAYATYTTAIEPHSICNLKRVITGIYTSPIPSSHVEANKYFTTLISEELFYTWATWQSAHTDKRGTHLSWHEPSEVHRRVTKKNKQA